MLGTLEPDVLLAGGLTGGDTTANERRSSPGLQAGIRAALAEDASLDFHRFEVAVTEVCGAAEVRVSGPRSALRLLFDRAELNPAFVAQVVRRKVERYRDSLSDHEGPIEKGESLVTHSARQGRALSRLPFSAATQGDR